jgi:hypothetical protein
MRLTFNAEWFSEGVKLIRWKPVFRLDHTAEGVTGSKTLSRVVRCYLATLTRVKGDCERLPDAEFRDGNNLSPFKSRTHRNILSAIGQQRTKVDFGPRAGLAAL